MVYLKVARVVNSSSLFRFPRDCLCMRCGQCLFGAVCVCVFASGCLCTAVGWGTGAGVGGRGAWGCLSEVHPPPLSWRSALGQARLEDVPHLASRDGPLLPEGRKGVHTLTGKVGKW